jgi:hypothetical protein
MEHVISQNLGLKPEDMGNLKTHWPSGNASPYIQERLRMFQGRRFVNSTDDQAVRESKLTEVFETIAQRRRSAVVKKEIWVVIGREFSRSSFVDQMSLGEHAIPTSLQAYQLLDSWIPTAASMDVDMKFLFLLDI